MFSILFGFIWIKELESRISSKLLIYIKVVVVILHHDFGAFTLTSNVPHS